MKQKRYRKMGEYGIKSLNETYQFRQSKKLYTARTERELMQYLKEKGIL